MFVKVMKIVHVNYRNALFTTVNLSDFSRQIVFRFYILKIKYTEEYNALNCDLFFFGEQRPCR